MKSLLIVSIATFLAASSCAHKDLNPGRCNSTSDCPSGQTCDLTQNGVCVCNSPGCADAGGGMGGGPGGMSGGGGAAGRAADGGGQDADAGLGCRTTCATPTPFCLNGTCVGCISNSDCGVATKPICDIGSNTCVACTSDSQCGTDPGICMSHVDGHCATIAETIYVQNAAGCSDSSPATGTSANPFCSMQPVPGFLTTTRDLVLVRGAVSGGTWMLSGQSTNVSVIGQAVGLQMPHVAGALSPAFGVAAGSAYLRGIEFSSGGPAAIKMIGGTVVLDGVTLDKSDDGIDLMGGALTVENSTISANSAIGINATSGTLSLSAVTVSNCAGGGILLNGVAFDLENTTVTSNGPGTFNGLTSWAGILVNNPPSAGATKINLSTVQANNGGGISCSTGIQGTAVLVDGNTNTPSQIGTSCGFSSCGTASSACGAQ